MGLEATASLIVATFDLMVVRSVRDAMRTADIASGKGQPATPLGPAPTFLRATGTGYKTGPAAVYEPREHVRLAPKVEPRIVVETVHYEARYEAQCNLAASVGAAAPEIPVTACVGVPAIPPVSAQLPPVPPHRFGAPRQPAKIIRTRTETIRTGMLVDLHV